MTREEFIQVLEKKGYRYHLDGERIIVDDYGYVWSDSIKSIPSGIVFKNGGGVSLRSLTSLPENVEFRNGGNVWLDGLARLSIEDLDYMFQNKGDVRFDGEWAEEREFPESRWRLVRL
jgi:hypothetical protein